MALLSGPKSPTLSLILSFQGFTFGPPFWGPLSEKFGRKPPLLCGLAISCVWSIMVALGHNVPTVMIGRFLTGVFGAAPVAIVGGAATDNWGPVARGINLTMIIGMLFGGPLLGPIIGNFVVQSNIGWRWNMWLVVIAGLVVSFLCLASLPESYPPAILRSKARKLRKETGDPNIKCKFDYESTSVGYICRVYLVRPWSMQLDRWNDIGLIPHAVLFFTEPILVFVTIYQAFIYGILYLFCSAYPIVFGEDRGWALGPSSLPLFSVHVGIFIGVCITVHHTMTIFARKVASNNGVVVPEDRLPLMILGGVVLPVGLFWFAWTADPSIPWPSVVVSGVVIGFGMFLIWIQCYAYLIDVYLPVANSAMASNSMVRSLFGFGFPLFASTMYHQLGTAWATSVLAFLSIAMIPVPVTFYIYGARIRSWSTKAIKNAT